MIPRDIKGYPKAITFNLETDPQSKRM